MQDETTLVNDVLSFNHIFRVRELEREVFLVGQSLDFKDCSEGSLADFRDDFVKLRRVVALNLAR